MISMVNDNVIITKLTNHIILTLSSLSIKPMPKFELIYSFDLNKAIING